MDSIHMEDHTHDQDLDDALLDAAMFKARLALEQAGLTVQDVLDELPAAGNEAMRRHYGDAFVDELERLHAELRGPSGV